MRPGDMSGCELKARGAGLSTHYVLSEAAFSGAVIREDGFDLNLSQSNDLQIQILTAQAFLTEHAGECRALADLLAPDVPWLEFALSCHEAPVQSFAFPAGLVRQAGALGFELRLSLHRIRNL